MYKDDFDEVFLESGNLVAESLGFKPYSGPNREEEAKRASSTLAESQSHRLSEHQFGGEKNPGGRPKGTQNKVTRTFKMAAEKAFEKGGGVKWLVGMMNGTASDRAAVLALFGRLIPHQLAGEVNHTVKVELNWLQGRQIGGGGRTYEQRQSDVADGEVRMLERSEDPESGTS